jgi:hypothetical protein
MFDDLPQHPKTTKPPGTWHTTCKMLIDHFFSYVFVLPADKIT